MSSQLANALLGFADAFMHPVLIAIGLSVFSASAVVLHILFHERKDK